MNARGNVRCRCPFGMHWARESTYPRPLAQQIQAATVPPAIPLTRALGGYAPQGSCYERVALQLSASTTYFALLATCKSLSTLNTPDTLLARISAMARSVSESTTPVRVTLPFFTMMWIA